jgi:tetratricopeptide (TPR) repeat protein
MEESMLDGEELAVCSLCKKRLLADGAQRWVSGTGEALSIGVSSTAYAFVCSSLGELYVCETCYASLPAFISQADRAEIHYQFGLEHGEKGNHQESLNCFMRALALERTPRLLSAIAGAYVCLGERDKAIASYKEALSLDSEEEVARANLATLLGGK